MKAAVKLKTLYARVEAIVRSDKRMIGNDRRVVCQYWCEQLGGIEMVKQMSLIDFFKAYCAENSILENHDYITRECRRVRELNEWARSSDYSGKKEAEQDVKQTIKDVGKPEIKSPATGNSSQQNSLFQ